MLLLAIIPLTMPALPMLWKCGLWAVAWLLLFDYFVAQVGFLRGLWWPRKVFLFLVLTVVLLAFVYEPIRSAWRAEQAALTTGILRAPDDGLDHSQELPILTIGEGGTSFTSGGKSPLFDFPEDRITIKREGNEVLLSTTVRDKEGNLIVEIVDNKWRVSDSTRDCWDKNYTSDSLEVKDGRGRVVLQVRVTPTQIHLQAEWPQVDGVFAQNDYNERTGITPRFKYPSKDYWGETIR